MTNSEIVTSTGDLGLSKGSFNRVRYVATRGPEDISLLPQYVFFAQQAINEGIPCFEGEEFTRYAGKFLITPEQLNDFDPEVLDHVEAIVPMTSQGNSDEKYFLMWVGVNHSDRKAKNKIQHIAEIYSENLLTELSKTPLERVKNALGSGYEFFNTIEPRFINQVYKQWSESFGWTYEQVEHLAQRLESEKNLLPEEKTVWFTSVIKEDEVKALMMAERQDIPIPDGKIVTTIESTEWFVDESERGNGAGAAGLSYNHAQIVNSMRNATNPWVLYAETNTNEFIKAYVVGQKVALTPHFIDGMSFPQILHQNVEVNGSMENFLVIALTQENFLKFYSEEDCNKMLCA